MREKIIGQILLALVGVVLVALSAVYVSTDAVLGLVGVAGGALIIVGAAFAVARGFRTQRYGNRSSG